LHVWAFDHLKATSEDRLRGDFYAQNVDRENLEKASATLEEFLASLDLQVDIRPMEAADVARVAQLSQRTNQFNFTGIRRTEPEISRVCEDGAECVVVRVRDRFGDYGLVGAMIFRQDKSVLALDSLFLSCRALGRRVEHQMLAYLGQVAGSRGRSHVQLRFKPTPKNQPAREFLDSVNASLEQCGEFLCWQAPTQGLEALDVVKNEIKTF
jgi:FkbH-like protein